jgi:hypothetical protein
MVGIAVVAPDFDPAEQVKSTFRVMSKTTFSGDLWTRPIPVLASIH